MALRAQLVAVATVVDIHLERRIERRTVRDVAARAADRAGLEASTKRQRLRTVEAIGPPVWPEFALIVVGGNRIAQQERHGVEIGRAHV